MTRLHLWYVGMGHETCIMFVCIKDNRDVLRLALPVGPETPDLVTLHLTRLWERGIFPTLAPSVHLTLAILEQRANGETS